MIEKVSIKNFKSINELELDTNLLNLYTGTNSSGKSTVLQCLLILAQNLEDSYGLNGPLVSIGSYREARNFNISSQMLKAEIYNGKETIGFQCDEDLFQIIGNPQSSLANKLNMKNGQLHYLSCNRIGSQDIYNRNMSSIRGIGMNGEFAIDFLCQHKDEPLDEELVKCKDSHTLLSQVNYWLKYIIGATIQPEEIIGTDVVKAGYGMVDGRYLRPRNVGAGVSYLISIIIAGLGSKKGDILLIENPEIHLHPAAQSKVCEFLYFVASTKRQLFVETHSDHIFNALRVGIATEAMDKRNIGINFLKLGSDNCTRNYEIEIGANGKIENPLPKLFDQFEMDYNKMLGL